MKSLGFLCIFLLFSHLAHAQFSENFSNYTTSGIPQFWSGETQNFIINSENELQLNAPAAGQTQLLHKNSLPDSAIFEINFRLEFAPSISNQLRIYLQSDNANLLISNGYYLEIGETGSNDALRFFRQNAGQQTLLATGILGTVADDPVEISLRVTRRANFWKAEIQEKNGGWQPQFSISENTFPAAAGQKFGLFCKYTDTRRDAFYFQKISAQIFQPDKTPPQILSVEALTDSLVQAVFSEVLDMSVLAAGNFSLKNFNQNLDAKFDLDLPNAVLLKLPFKLNANQSYTLKIKELTDLEGNKFGAVEQDFLFKKTEKSGAFDLLINEIMADPTPAVGLPETEWIELFNVSDKTLQLGSLTLEDASGQKAVFPQKILEPKEFLVILPPGVANFPASNGQVLPLQNFPNLNNDGDQLVLKNADGEVVDAVHFSNSWHSETSKTSGGWSLERRNPQAPCLGGKNWGSTAALVGGTPGAKNSIEKITKDETPPRLLFAFPETTDRVFLKFSEGLDAASVGKISNFKITPDRKILQVEIDFSDRSQAVLYLAEPLEIGQIYNLEFFSGLTDCVGNSIENSKPVLLGLSEIPENQDVIINEILFDPKSGGSRFLEIVNHSGKMLDFQNLVVADFSGNSPAVNISQKRLFSPGEIIVLANDTADISKNFEHVLPENLLKINLPTFADDAGKVQVFWSKNGVAIVLDTLNYTNEMHNNLLSTAEKEGVSLEKIRADLPSDLLANWTSAAGNFPYFSGTPTQPNSQSKNPLDPTQTEFISLISNRLSPDGDGKDDFLEINFQLPQPGFAATFSIFSADGFLVKKLVRQELLGISGTVRWDGDTDGGERARPGIHMLFAEIYHPDGQVLREKKVFTVVF